MNRHFDISRFVRSLSIAFLASVFGLPLNANADQLRLIESDGNRATLDVRVVASEQGVTLVELNTGEYRLIPNGAILDRKPTDDPVPMTAAELAAHLCKKFPDGLTRSMDLDQYAVVVVLGSPIRKPQEARVKTILTRATKFLKGVESVYSSYCKRAEMVVEPPRLPLGMLIFETERDFDVYAAQSTGGGANLAVRISGFYSGLSNLLAMRLSECLSFEVPAHEAMHQQSYNRGTFQRLASIPRWFDEGLATGFETVGAKISGSPFRISTRYARQALDSNRVSWDDMLKTDQIFLGDVLVGEAYGQAWGLHWLLLTRHKKGYAKYVQNLATKLPLQKQTGDERMRDFVDAFGKRPDEIEAEFLPMLNAKYDSARKVETEHQANPRTLIVNDGLADVEVLAERTPQFGNALLVTGRLRNASPIRPMSFYVCVETDTGACSEWFVPDVPVNQIVNLEKRPAVASGNIAALVRPSRSFSVKIRSTTPDSDEAKDWKLGKYPGSVRGIR